MPCTSAATVAHPTPRPTSTLSRRALTPRATPRSRKVGCQAAGSVWDELEARRARGIKSLVEAAPDQALVDLWAVWEHCEREGVLNPGVFPVGPDLVEALVELAPFEDADAVTAGLRELAMQQDHPWATATAKRCAGVLELASGDGRRGAALLAEASSD